MNSPADDWVKTDDESIDEFVDGENTLLMRSLIYKLKDERDAARVALDACDRYTYGWTFGTVGTVIDRIRLTVREALR